METTGVRRLLIVFFALLNILFFVMYLYEYKSNEYVSAEYVNSAVTNLSERGIAVSPDVFVTHLPQLPAGMLVTDKNGQNGRRVSDAVVRFTLGNVKTRSLELENPDGVSLSFYNEDEQFSHIQLAKTFYGKNSFNFEYSDYRYANKAEAPEIFYNKLSRDISYDEKRLLSELVSCFGVNQPLNYRIAGCSSYADGTVFTLVQTFGGIDINDMFMNVLVWNGEILSVKGSWISSQIEKNYSYDIEDGINAVFSLDLDTVSEIVSEKCVYVLRRSDENKYYLLPVWEIEYTDVDGNALSDIIEANSAQR